MKLYYVIVAFHKNEPQRKSSRGCSAANSPRDPHGTQRSVTDKAQDFSVAPEVLLHPHSKAMSTLVSFPV